MGIQLIKIFSILIVIFLISCDQKIREDTKLFSLMPPDATDINFGNYLTENEEFNIIDYLYFNNGGGVAAGDVNNDGLVDLYFTGSQLPNKLYLNKGNMEFEDITEKAGVSGEGDWTTGVTMADVNGDGLLDIYVCQVGNYKGMEGSNQLFINNGDLTFTGRAEEYGIAFSGFSTQAAFFDYDLDGDLDLFLLNHSVHSTRTYGQVDLRAEFDPQSGDRLYRNELDKGENRFTDVTKGSGIYSSQIGYGLNVSVGDLNNDGFPDLFVSNDFHENDYLYINNGNGTFSDHFTEAMAHSSRSSMGNDIGDFNNDGLLDILVLDMLPEREDIRQRVGGEDDYDVYNIKRSYGYHHQFVRNTLHMNLGEGLFSEIGRLGGIHATDWSWSPLWCDLDNDGWKDLFITNGIFRRPNDLDYIQFLTSNKKYINQEDDPEVSDRILYEKMPLDSLVNYAYKNNRDYTFTNKAEEWGFDRSSFSNGAVYADLDNDGDLDLVINNINAPAFIYRNNSESFNGNNFLQVHFSGEGNNQFGIGARAVVYGDGHIQVAENHTTRGFFSSVSPTVHFGLGTLQQLDSVDIYWPENKFQRLYEVEANQVVKVSESGAVRSLDSTSYKKGKRLFNEVQGRKNIDFVHKENNFIDFRYERLMPHSLSSEGPPVAVGDVNNDQLDDIYFGGAHDQPPELYIQNEDGNFYFLENSVFENAAFYEDVDATFFDADRDGDLDLYVVSGGNEYMAPNPLLKDRLYLNDGEGNFTIATNQLPVFYHNGSCVVPCDYDGDGDLDLFIGSRSIPRKYGLAPDSFLWINNGDGYFTDGTPSLAPGLSGLGMVTDAVWTDLDNDGDKDLAVVGEWMPLTIFINEAGNLVNQDPGNELVSSAGWWFTLEVCDVDNDGDEDLIAGNLGLNAYLKASGEEPVKMYINDFDGNGSLDQIITFRKDGREYPFASADDLFRQIPALKRNYKSYSDFAGREIYQILPKEELNNSIVRTAYCFESSIFINTGNGEYNRNALPMEIQFSPVRDMVIDDFDGDQIPDIITGGNYNSVVPYYGRYDASYGWFMQWKKEQGFEVVFPAESGLSVKGEVNTVAKFHSDNKKMILFGINNGQPELFSTE